MTTSPSAASRPDRRVARTRRLLQEALLELVHEKDYDTITVQDILDRADVGRSTFYAHFRNKDQLLLGDFGVRGLESRSPEQAPLLPGWTGLLEHFEENYGLYKALSGTEGLPLALDRLRRSIAESWETRLSLAGGDTETASLPPVVVNHFLTGALMEVIEWWLRAGMPYPPHKLNQMLERLTVSCLASLARSRQADGAVADGD